MPKLKSTVLHTHLIIKLFVTLTVVVFLLSTFSACGSKKSEPIPSSTVGSDAENQTVIENDTIPYEDYLRIKSEITILVCYLYEYNDEAGSMNLYRTSEITKSDRHGIVEGYFNHNYAERVDSLVCDYDFQNEIVYGKFDDLNDLYRFFFGKEISNEDIEAYENLFTDGNEYTATIRPFSLAIDSTLIASDKTEEGYRLIVTNEGAESGEEPAICGTWIVELKKNDNNIFGYEVISAETIRFESVMETAPSCIKNNFDKMNYPMTLLMREPQAGNHILCNELTDEQLANVLHGIADSVGFSGDFEADEDEVKTAIRNLFGPSVSAPTESKDDAFQYDDGRYYFSLATGVNYGWLYPVYIKEKDNEIYVYAERFYNFSEPQYLDSWEIIFEQDEQSDYGCHIVSMTTIDEIQGDSTQHSPSNDNTVEGYTEDEWDQIIEEFMNNFDQDALLAYALIDINQDGLDELIIRETTSEFLGTDNFHVFIEKNGNAVQLTPVLSGYYPELYYSKASSSIVTYTRTSSNMNYDYFLCDNKADALVENGSIMWERDYTDGIEVVKYYQCKPDGSTEQFYEHDYATETIGDNPKWKEYIDELEEVVFSPL